MGGGIRTWIACLALVLFAAAGCGGDDGASESASQESPTATTEGATSPESEDADGDDGGDADGGEEGPGESTGDGDSEGAGGSGSGGAGGGDSAANSGGGDSDGPSAGGGGGRSGGTDGGSGDVGGPGATPEGGDQPQAESDEEWPPDDLVTITIKDSKFTPQRVTVPKDGWIMWVNKEEKTVHTATKTRGPSYAPNSPPIYWGGDTYTDTFLARGEIEYICTKHPLKMKGFITVK